MLVVPMRNHLDNIIGVIQLLNSKKYTKGESIVSGNEAFDVKLESRKIIKIKLYLLNPGMKLFLKQ